MFKKLDYTEPAVLRGIAVAGFGLATSIGFVVPQDLPGQVEVLIVGVTTVLPVLQALWTRMKVWSPKGKDEAVAVARHSN